MKVALPEPEIVTRKGKAVSVIISIKAYEKLLARIEEAEDAAEFRRARSTSLAFRPLRAYLADRKAK